MLAKIKDILIITCEEFIAPFKNLLGDGSRLGISISYKIQEKPEGIAQAFHIAEEFIGDDAACLVLGDNLFYGQRLPEILIDAKERVERTGGSVIFGYNVSHPERYGVAEIVDNKVVSIAEKPKNPKSNWAVVGLYMYDNSVVDISKKIKPSARGELEITTVNQMYMKNKKLEMTTMGRGYTWFDTGNPEDLFSASSFVRMVESRQGLKIACIEEIAYYMGYISLEDTAEIARDLSSTEYGKYLRKLVDYESTRKEGVFEYDQR
jgi:glucose-1-phosphate thymidylyltransferase